MSPATVAIAPVEASSCLAVAMQDEQCSILRIILPTYMGI